LQLVVHDQHQEVELVLGVNEDCALGNPGCARDRIRSGLGVTVAFEKFPCRSRDASLRVLLS
jgi:hypothetical protein